MSVSPPRRPHTSGDGWVECVCGQRHWGRNGAAGLLLHRDGHVLLQHRAEWSHHGGTWALPGGAIMDAERPVQAAIREAREEAGVPADAIRVDSCVETTGHGSWSYTTIVATATRDVDAYPADAESLALAWVPLGEVTGLPLHPGFASTWPSLLGLAGRRLQVVVDAANVMGTTPNGWWRDRAGAARELHARLAAGVRAGFPATLPAAAPLEVTTARPDRWWPDATLVVEGAARAMDAGTAASGGSDGSPPPGSAGASGAVRVVRAAGSGDDSIVAEVARLLTTDPAGPCWVVTADRELRRRVAGRGAQVVGPRALLGALDEAGGAAPGTSPA